MSSNVKIYNSLHDIAKSLKQELASKKYVLIFAYNKTGKTRLSCEFKNLIKSGRMEDSDTLYYNAYTEDLFTWDNNLESNINIKLLLNRDTKFFSCLKAEYAMEERISKHLSRYADFSFKIDYEEWFVTFSREIRNGTANKRIDNIKIPRAEEFMFIWCFFLAILDLVIEESDAYKWVKYVYIDDPISSLDDNNAIAVANHLVQIIEQKEDLKVIISSHHSLFFNVLHNEFLKKSSRKFMLLKDNENLKYIMQDTNDSPFLYHIAVLRELKQAIKTGKLYTYHFNILRNILEKSANFHGFKSFGECIKNSMPEINDSTYVRYINILSHGNYSLYEPKEMVEDNKRIFKEILERYLNLYKYNNELFNDNNEEVGGADE